LVSEKNSSRNCLKTRKAFEIKVLRGSKTEKKPRLAQTHEPDESTGIPFSSA
jgi:hypothetical protein